MRRQCGNGVYTLVRTYFALGTIWERGLTLVNAQWLIAQLRLPNVKFAPTGVPTISEMMGMADNP